MGAQFSQAAATLAVNKCDELVLQGLVIQLKQLVYCKKRRKELSEELKKLETFLKEWEGRSYDEFIGLWLEDLRGALRDGEELLQRYSTITCSPCSRIKLSRRAEDIVQRVNASKNEKYLTIRPSQIDNCRSSEVRVIAPSRSYKFPNLVVGMDHHTQGLIQLVLSSNVHKIGVCGQGGSGKTLLTHLLQREQKVKDHFDGKIFSIEVGYNESPNKMWIQELQGKLYKEITGKDKTFDTRDNGKAEIYTLIKNHRCLLIIDNVWDFEVLDWLDVMEPQNGSKILVTTRYSLLVDQFKASKVIINRLSPENSWKLFCNHAFGGESDVVKDEDILSIVNAVMDYFGGLPLALKVMGTSMSGKSELRHWQIFEKRVKDSGPINEHQTNLYKCLKFSYDELARKGFKIQDCFLDLALCSTNHSIWDLYQRWQALNLMDSYEDATDVLDTLKDYFFVSDFDPYNPSTSGVKIHDHIRGLAAYIMESEKQGQVISKFRRKLTKFPNISSVIRKMDLEENEIEYLPHQPVMAMELELIDLSDNPLTSGISKGFFQAFPNLKLLDLDRIKCEVSIESLASLTKLEALYLSRNIYDYLEEGHFSCKTDHNQALNVLPSLRYVSLAGYCPSFCASSSFIQELYIDVSYECLLHLPHNLHSSIGNLKILSIFVDKIKAYVDEENDEIQHLFVDMEFINLRIFQLHIGRLSSSKVSYISKMNWGAFPKLHKLSLSNLDWFQVNFASSLDKLEELNMYDYCLTNHCRKDPSDNYLSFGLVEHEWKKDLLQVLPNSIGHLPHLKMLNVAMCPMVEIDCGEDKFPQLKELFVYSQHNVRRVPAQIRIVDLPSAMERCMKSAYTEDHLRIELNKAIVNKDRKLT